MPPAGKALPAPELIAHRGAPRERPENTLAAFSRALELGADGIELDVHASSDGVVVVHHDPVPRATPPNAALAGREIRALTADELRGFRVEGEVVPTLHDVLDLVGTRAIVYVEIKGRGIERAVVDCITEHRTECAVHSFDHRAVGRVRDLAPGLRRGILLDAYLVDTAAALRSVDARDLWQQWRWIDPPLVEQARAAGARVVAWTVNARTEAASLCALGVSALCSDTLPELLPLRGTAGREPS